MPYKKGKLGGTLGEEEDVFAKYSQFLSPSYLKQYDKEVKKKTSPSLFMRALSLLTTGESAPGVYEAISKNDPLAGVSGYLKGIGSSIKGTGLQNKTYRDVLELIGMDRTALSEKLPFLYNETGEGWQLKGGGFVDPTDTGTLGLALDILGDPKTYMAGAGLFMRAGRGISGLSRAGKQLWISAGEKAAKEAAEIAAKKGLSSGATTMLESKLLQESRDLLVKSFKKDPDKYFSGITFLGQNVVPRKFAKLPGVIVDKTMSTVPVVNKVYSGVKNGIQDMFVAYNDLRKAGKASDFAGETVDDYINTINKYEKNKRALMSDYLVKASKTWDEVRKTASRADIDASYDDIAEYIEKGLSDYGVEKLPREAVEKIVKFSRESSDAFLAGEIKAAERLGLEAVSVIENYFPHERTDFARKALENASVKNPYIKAGLKTNEKSRIFKKFVSETGDDIVGTAEVEGLQKYSKAAEEKFIKNHVDNLITRREEKLLKLEKDIVGLEKSSDRVADSVFTAEMTGEAIKAGVKPKINGITKLVDDLLKIPEKEYKAIERKLVSKDKEYVETLKEISELRADIKEKVYKLPEHDIYYKDKAGNIYKEERNMTVNEINNKMQPFMDANGQKGKKYMVTDPFEANMARGKRSAMLVSKRNFLADVVEQFGKTGDVIKKYDRIPNKRKMKVSKEIIGQEVDGVKYIDASSVTDLPEGTILPDFIVNDLQKLNNVVDDDKIITKLTKAYDKALNVFKGSVYGWYPASHGRNAIGGLFNNFLGNPKSFKFIGEAPYKIVYGKPDDIVKAGKLEFKVSEIRQMIKETGILGQTGIYDVNESLVKLKRGGLDKFKNAPMSAMEFVENNVRLPLFLAELSEGKSAREAANTVFRYHFDYAPEALSEFERNVMRRLIPFYRWTRGNIPLMLEEMISQPGKMTGTFKFIRDMSDEQGNLDRSLLPSYQESEAPIMKGGEALSGLGLPPIEMLKYLTDFKKQAESGVTPFIKIPVEVRTNYSLFKDKVISEDVNGNFATNYPEAVKEWLEWEDTTYEKDGKKITNSRVNPSKKYMLYALPTGRMASMFSSVMDEEEANTLLRHISGIRTLDVDRQRMKDYAEYKFDKKILEIFEDAGVFSKNGNPYKVYSDQVD